MVVRLVGARQCARLVTDRELRSGTGRQPKSGGPELRGAARTTKPDRDTTRREPQMMLDLSREDAAMLREVLQNYLPELMREVARTEVKTLRHELVQRQELCERLLQRLSE